MSDLMCSRECGNDVDYPVCSTCEGRDAELAHKRGFDAGVEFQKKAAPTPKAKEFRAALKEATGALRDLHHHAMWDPDGELTREEFDALFNAAEQALRRSEALLR